jgi:hypothetical protein
MSFTVSCEPFTTLPEQRVYRIVEIHEADNNIFLVIRGRDNPREYRVLLLPRSLTMAFRTAELKNQQLNGAASEMKLKYYGCDSIEGTPIFRIAGKGFCRFLV